MKQIIIVVIASFIISTLSAQVAINTDGSIADASAMLDVSSTAKGMLIPRMSETERNSISSPATGLMVFVTDDSTFYYYDNSSWQKLGQGASGWNFDNPTISCDSINRVVIGKSSGTGIFQVITDWATGTYGADVCTGGTESSQENAAGKPASEAFDNDNATYWSNDGNLPVWLQYSFGADNGKVIAAYRIYYEGGSYDASPKEWEFQASDDGLVWTTIDSRNGENWTGNSWKLYTFSNTARYEHYRILIYDNKGVSDDYVYINEMEMQEMIYNNHQTLFVDNNRVGIGTSSPSKTLHVQGTFRLAEGSHDAGKVLVSDASGNASWTDGSLVNGGGWTINGDYVFNTSDSIGIGTSSPGAMLDVHGHISQTGIGHSVFIGNAAGTNDNLTDNNNVFVGDSCEHTNTTGYSNVAIGANALKKSADRSNLVAIGDSALYNNGDGATQSHHSIENTAVGSKALYSNSTGYQNIAVGSKALYSNTTGYGNIAVGSNALYSNTSASFNSALGFEALYSNNTGLYNVATGYRSLCFNTTGGRNSASGYRSLFLNTTGSGNTSYGHEALCINTTGYSNVAIGIDALKNNIDRSNLVAMGDSALFNNGDGATLPFQSIENTAVGSKAMYSNTVGSGNQAFGYNALYSNTEGSGNVSFGNQSLYSNTSASDNVAMGNKSLYSNTTGSNNCASGYKALYSNTTGNYGAASGYQALSSNTTGNYNAAFGSHVLYNNTTGNNNVAMGRYSLFYNTTGFSNVAIGTDALRLTTTQSNLVAIGDSALYNNGTGASHSTHAIENTAIGSKAMYSNTTGHENTASGYQSLYSNTTGFENVATGHESLYSNTTGRYNVASGYKALHSNTTGWYNTAAGYNALHSNTTGSYNTSYGRALTGNKTGRNNIGIGHRALMWNTTGDDNIGIGYYALLFNINGYSNTAIGYQSLYYITSGYNNTAIGYGAGPAEEDSTFYNTSALGYSAVPTTSNDVMIGNSFVNWIGGAVDWSTTSDSRFKRNIKENVHGLDFITSLRPVTFQWDIKKLDRYKGLPDSLVNETSMQKSRMEKEQIVYTGFIAQEVEAAAQKAGYQFSGVHHPENDHDPYSIAYAQFVVPLVKAVQEQQDMIEEQRKMIEQLMQEVERLKNR